jgi:hypothetical protein
MRQRVVAQLVLYKCTLYFRRDLDRLKSTYVMNEMDEMKNVMNAHPSFLVDSSDLVLESHIVPPSGRGKCLPWLKNKKVYSKIKYM